MTHKHFWTDPYATRHDTTVAAVDGPRITLHSTIFFAFSGGQESDTGTIGGWPVLLAETAGLSIVYTLPPEHDLQPGQAVTILIDGDRRRRLMRLHFAAELVLELVCRAVPQIFKSGAHIAQTKARIDFACEDSLAPLLPAIADTANNLIVRDLAIRSAFSDPAQERRYWEIDGFSRVPCGGTHVERTSEIGPIRLRREKRGHHCERIEIFLADAPG
jgi:Ser-tRNA(Ala) deacylase AlaX